MKKTMKKIKRLDDIEREKMRLRVQQLEQERAIRQEWNELKEMLRPGTLIRNKLAELSSNSMESLLRKGWRLLRRKLL
jgi:hypothetical protein